MKSSGVVDGVFEQLLSSTLEEIVFCRDVASPLWLSSVINEDDFAWPLYVFEQLKTIKSEQ